MDTPLRGTSVKASAPPIARISTPTSLMNSGPCSASHARTIRVRSMPNSGVDTPANISTAPTIRSILGNRDPVAAMISTTPMATLTMPMTISAPSVVMYDRRPSKRSGEMMPVKPAAAAKRATIHARFFMTVLRKNFRRDSKSPADVYQITESFACYWPLGGAGAAPRAPLPPAGAAGAAAPPGAGAAGACAAPPRPPRPAPPAGAGAGRA